MSDSLTHLAPPVTLCLASFFKGGDFLRECRARGARVVLVTREAMLGEDWPRESIDEVITVPDEPGPEDFLERVSAYARRHRIARVVALEEYDVLTAALLREHLCLAGMESTTARRFRDKLAMRVRAREQGVAVPEFVHALNFEEVGDFVRRVPSPWVLKPRADVSAIGIQKLSVVEEVWRALDELERRDSAHERPTHFLLERFVEGAVYHVDSLVEGGRVVFAAASRYGRPPFEVAHRGGVFLSSSIQHDSAEERELLALNERVLAALGLARGAAHAEFIRSAEDESLYFLEAAARVGGAFLAETVEAGTGVNLWRAWAGLELSGDEDDLSPFEARREYSGIVLSLARQEEPDTSAYTDPEIVYRVKKRHHVGLIVRSPALGRVNELLDSYARRFVEDFCAVLPPLERPR